MGSMHLLQNKISKVINDAARFVVHEDGVIVYGGEEVIVNLFKLCFSAVGDFRTNVLEFSQKLRSFPSQLV